jgi:glutaredoxin
MAARILGALVACMVLLGAAVGADKAEYTVYFFWSASCPYSKAARTFLQAAQAKDPALRLRDFEVDQSLPNARLLGRLYDKIGLPETRVVPTIVIGHHVIVGYIDDATTGVEILSTLDGCRKTSCKDAVHELMETQDRLEAMTGIAPARRIVCRREPGRAVR